MQADIIQLWWQVHRATASATLSGLPKIQRKQGQRRNWKQEQASCMTDSLVSWLLCLEIFAMLNKIN